MWFSDSFGNECEVATKLLIIKIKLIDMLFIIQN